MAERLNFYEDIYLSKKQRRRKPGCVHLRQNSAPTFMVYHRNGNPSPPPGNHKTSSTSAFESRSELYEPTDSVQITNRFNPSHERVPALTQRMSTDGINHKTNLTRMQRITKSADNLRFKQMSLRDQTTALAPYLWMRPSVPSPAEAMRSSVKQSYSCGSLSHHYERENNSLSKRPHQRLNNKSSMDSVGNESSNSSLDSGNGSSLSVQESRRARSIEPHTLSPIKINTRHSSPGGLYPSQKVPRSGPNKPQANHFLSSDNNNGEKLNRPTKSMQRHFYSSKHPGLHSRDNSLVSTTEESEKELNYVQLDLRDLTSEEGVTPYAVISKTNSRPDVAITPTQDSGVDNDDSVEYTLINLKATEAVRRANHEHKLYRDRMQWPDTVHARIAS